MWDAAVIVVQEDRLLRSAIPGMQALAARQGRPAKDSKGKRDN